MGAQTTSSGVRFENVLYTTDFHGYSKAALPYALSIARKYGSKVYAAHIISLSPFPNTAPTGAWRAIEAQAVREAKEAMIELSPDFAGIPNEVLIRKGDIWKEMSAIVKEKRIDLIVAGTHGRGGVSKMVMGSVAERIFRQAPCPVLTVGPKVHGEADGIADLHTILVPTDFSFESLNAVPYAISLAQANQARLYLLHVTKGGQTPESSLKTVLRNLIPSGTDLSCEPKAFVEAGIPSEKILDLAQELAVDLIVLGVKPPAIFHGTSTHLALATAYKVASEAICPIITVRGHRKLVDIVPQYRITGRSSHDSPGNC